MVPPRIPHRLPPTPLARLHGGSLPVPYQANPTAAKCPALCINPRRTANGIRPSTWIRTGSGCPPGHAGKQMSPLHHTKPKSVPLDCRKLPTFRMKLPVTSPTILRTDDTDKHRSAGAAMASTAPSLSTSATHKSSGTETCSAHACRCLSRQAPRPSVSAGPNPEACLAGRPTTNQGTLRPGHGPTRTSRTAKGPSRKAGPLRMHCTRLEC